MKTRQWYLYFVIFAYQALYPSGKQGTYCFCS